MSKDGACGVMRVGDVFEGRRGGEMGGDVSPPYACCATLRLCTAPYVVQILIIPQVPPYTNCTAFHQLYRFIVSVLGVRLRVGLYLAPQKTWCLTAGTLTPRAHLRQPGGVQRVKDPQAVPQRPQHVLLLPRVALRAGHRRHQRLSNAGDRRNRVLASHQGAVQVVVQVLVSKPVENFVGCLEHTCAVVWVWGEPELGVGGGRGVQCCVGESCRWIGMGVCSAAAMRVRGGASVHVYALVGGLVGGCVGGRGWEWG